MWSADELVAASATAHGRGGRAIVRIAGSGLEALIERLVDREEEAATVGGGRPRLRTARLAAAGLGRSWGAVPVDLVSWSGETGPVGGALVELHLPNSAPLVDAVVTEACRHGARIARGGEFTMRAFLAGRLDLLQAEAVVAVVDADEPAALAAALDRMAGGAGGRLDGIRSDLLDMLADIEAAIDFADATTPDAPPGADRATWAGLATRLEAADAALDAAGTALERRAATAAGSLPRAVLAGPPDIGKSSLFNAIVGRDAALVAAGAGTTRDWLEVRLDLPLPDRATGVACALVDVAGLEAEPAPPSHAHREAPDDPGARAAVAARSAIAGADVVIVCRDACDPGGTTPPTDGRPRIEVLTLCDRVSAGGQRAAIEAGAIVTTRGTTGGGIATSSRSGEGLDQLRTALARAVAALPPRGSPATVRLASGLATARTALLPAIAAARRAAAGGSTDEALLAGDVRRAVAALGEVTGANLDVELLDRIFARHCIGK
jgi:tRNA modification GTPase